MASPGLQLTEVWAEHKEKLMSMVLGSLESINVNIHWSHRPEVTKGLIVGWIFAQNANGGAKNCHITLQEASSAFEARRSIYNSVC